MKIQYCSDLHLEFWENADYLKANPLIPSGEILLLAGDIVKFPNLSHAREFFRYCSENFKQTYWVPGNHEYYGSDIKKWTGEFRHDLHDNVALINNMSVKHDDVRLVFSTMWTHISEARRFQIERGLSDFHVIKNHGKKLTVDMYNDLHYDSLRFLNGEIIERFNPTETVVVVTHHVPTMMNYPPRFRGDALNEAFAVELYDAIADSCADYWVFGHTHYNVEDFDISNTRMRTNQLGYVKYNENEKFDCSKTIEIF